jgi:hypothetical protein
MRNISRRNAINTLVGAAGLSVIPVAAGAMTPDPIFAAIARHKASNAALEQVLDGMTNCQEEHGFGASPELEEWYRREAEAGAADDDALHEMLGTVPTTLSGVVALLRYISQEHDEGNPILDNDGEELLSTTISALVAIGGVS